MSSEHQKEIALNSIVKSLEYWLEGKRAVSPDVEIPVVFLQELLTFIQSQAADLATYKQEYKLAAAANKGLSAALDKEREGNKSLRLQIFAFVRNSSVLYYGLKEGKTQQEITDITLETIEEAKKMLDVERMRAFLNLATDEGKRYDRE